MKKLILILAITFFSCDNNEELTCNCDGKWFIPRTEQRAPIEHNPPLGLPSEVIPTEYNLNNGTDFFIFPKENNIIFFPSEIYHKTDIHKDEIERNCIAFNLMPIGELGEKDSYLKLNFI
jgi:hypothetical protein